MHTKLSAAVFGHTNRGDYGHGHDLALSLHPDVKVIAVADPDAAGRRAARKRIGAARGYGDYRALLEAEKPDLVAIASRHVEDHAAQIVASAQCGVKGILCEKPMAATLEEADAALRACAESGTQLVVAHRRASAYEIHAHEMVRRGEIGTVVEMRGRGKGDHRAGGEDLAVLGVHILDSMRWFAGSDPQWVCAHVAQGGRPAVRGDRRPGNEGIGYVAGDALMGLFLFEGGLPATFTSYGVARGTGESHSNWFGFEVYGTHGALSVRNSPGGLLFHAADGMCAPGAPEGWQRIWLPGWERDGRGRVRDGQARMMRSNRIMVEELVNAVRDGTPITRASTGRDALWALEMIMGIHVSHLTGARVPLPLRQRRNPYADA